MKGTQSVYQLLSPQQTEVFLTDGQRVVHGFVQSQLENENKIFDILIDICQIFRDGLLDRLVTVHHILYENVQIIILFTHQPCQIDAQNLVDFLCYIRFGCLVSNRFTLRKQGCFEIEQGKYF